MSGWFGVCVQGLASSDAKGGGHGGTADPSSACARSSALHEKGAELAAINRLKAGKRSGKRGSSRGPRRRGGSKLEVEAFNILQLEGVGHVLTSTLGTAACMDGRGLTRS